MGVTYAFELHASEAIQSAFFLEVLIYLTIRLEQEFNLW